MWKTADLPAATSQLAWSVVVDVALGAALAASLSLLAARHSVPLAVVVGVSAALVMLGAWWWMRAALGTSAGHGLLGLRTVARSTGMPGHPFAGARATLNIREGQDPLRLVPSAIELAPPTRVPQRFSSPDLELSFDDGSRHVVRGVVIVGRAPQVTSRGQRPVAVPDFSRSLAPTHVRLEPNFDGVLVTDLGSVGGTWAFAGGDPKRLQPETAITVPFGTVLALGSRRVRLGRPGAAAVGAGVAA
ncbi:FHA domain-containing protein [Pseudoclavibacter helvolus]|uniref:FHA domain-containing protein n=1 Tax=Pseudoclavibacter helvolus TaxID=255205 RepID=UPI0024AE3AA1|nr:FHA domain-containing protein [Pseudoclavibacter helvolus]